MLRSLPFPRRIATIAAAGLLVLGASSCAPAAETGQEKLQVVTSTTVYSSLVEEVLGDRGDVTALVTSSAQDPHSYEASAHDKLRLSKAKLVVLNGGGYDAFAENIVNSLPEPPQVLEAFEGEGHSHGADADAEAHEEATPSADDAHDHGNEHVWYDLHTMGHFVHDLEEKLSELDPAGAAGFAQRAEALEEQLEGLEKRLEAIKPLAKGKGYLMTEPVAQSLLDDAGLSNQTPDGLAEAIEEGDEISPLALKRAKDALSSGSVAVLAYNSQTTDEQTVLLRAAANEAGVPVLEVSEAPPAGVSYVDWMSGTISNLEGALR